jgi:hypothetical protein
MEENFGIWRDPKNYDDGTECYSITGVPKMFPTVTVFWAK